MNSKNPEKLFYKCDPAKNTECTKEACQRECFHTTKKEYAMARDKGLTESEFINSE